MSNTIVQPSNVAPRTTNTNAAGITTITGSGYFLPYLPNVAQQTSQPQFFMSAFPLQFTLISDATAQTTDTYEMQVLGRNLHAIAVSTASGTTFSATVLVEATLDGTNWFTLASLTSTGITQYSGVYQSIRVSIPSYTSGTITVSGMTQRT